MTAALTQIYALQQRELTQKERQRQQAIAKQQRTIAAFNASGLIAIFNDLRDVPLRADVRQRLYKATVGELTWQASMGAERLSDMSFLNLYGTGSSSLRWWCAENNDSGTVYYWYNSGRAGDSGTRFDKPEGEWLDRFVEYIAAAADPDAIAEKMRTIAPTNTANHSRRQVQPV
jgi:hypothetical protein